MVAACLLWLGPDSTIVRDCQLAVDMLKYLEMHPLPILTLFLYDLPVNAYDYPD